MFSGTVLLDAEDLSNLPWSIILLEMGGILGKAITSSCLLKIPAGLLELEVTKYNTFLASIAFGLLTFIVSIFVSQNVAALKIIYLVGLFLPLPQYDYRYCIYCICGDGIINFR